MDTGHRSVMGSAQADLDLAPPVNRAVLATAAKGEVGSGIALQLPLASTSWHDSGCAAS